MVRSDPSSTGPGEVAIIELGASNLSIGVDKGLLVDTPDPLQIANLERVLV